METSIFIVRILGLAYVVFGLGMFLFPDFYNRMYDEMAKSAAHVFWAGLLALMTGFLIVSYHNIWTGDWTVLVTLFGWLALLKGIFFLVFPEAMIRLFQALLRHCRFWAAYCGFFIFSLGLVFLYFGYTA